MLVTSNSNVLVDFTQILHFVLYKSNDFTELVDFGLSAVM